MIDMHKYAVFFVLPLLATNIFSTVPSSSNFTLPEYDFGTGGGTGSSTNYKLNGISGSQSGAPASSANYSLNPGLIPNQNAYVPAAPTFTNPDTSYSRLSLIINNGSNPSTTKFVVAISTDNFVTTNYVQSDNTIGPVLGPEDYQTYAAWGGASGVWVVGLTPNTTYKVKSKAMMGDFTETAYGPIATAATVQPSITFAVTTSASSTPPFSSSFGDLVAGATVAADADPMVSLTTNALFGGDVYVSDAYTGLYSSNESYTLPSASADLSTVSKGYGGQVISVGQASGGPFASLSPYNGASNNVGGFTTALQSILSTDAPITNGTSTIRLKAKAEAITPAATDYTDTITLVAAMTF